MDFLNFAYVDEINLVKESVQRFNAWCLLKGHTYLNKPAAENCRFKYVSPFSEHQ